MQQDEDTPLSGSVEADETYVGAKRRRGSPRGRPGPDHPYKTPVFAVAERGGRVIAKVVPDTTAKTLRGEIVRFVLPGTMIFTDEYLQYSKLGQMGYGHRRVHHKTHVYVSGEAHTNTLESFFGHFKNDVRGTHHAVSRKWLQTYLNEWAWKWNHRKDETPWFHQLLAAASGSH